MLVDKTGFTILKADQCSFIKGEGEDRVFITNHVDDLGIGGTSKNMDRVLEELKAHCKLKIQRGESTAYLGMNVTNHLDGTRTIDQGGYRKEITLKYAADINLKSLHHRGY